ncbi:MAG: hypothetical protein HY748_05995 [Elusimicrobia bacterium]|nr:hypothetical protein [Elusimicrobiota bacterium]
MTKGILLLIAACVAVTAHAGPQRGRIGGSKAPAGETQPSHAALSPEREAAQWAEHALGPDAFEILRDKRYLILQDGEAGPRLQDAQWDALRELSRLSMVAVEFAEAYRRFAAGNPAAPAGDALPFAPLRGLPSSGLMTAHLHAAAEIMAAAHDEYSALDPKALAGEPQATLFETPWGAAFASRTRADLKADPSGLADAFFDGCFASVPADAGAAAHFKKHVSAVFQKDVGPSLDADIRNASLSGDLRTWLQRYLLDQRRLNSLKRYHSAVEKLDAKHGLVRQAAELETAAKALAAAPEFVGRLRGKLSRLAPAAQSPKAHLTSAGLHLHQPVKLERYERGDTVVLTGGYWVDGLADGEAAEIEETSFADYGSEGLGFLETRRVRRRNGGLYEIRRELPLSDARSFTFRTVVSGTEANALAEKAAVPVSEAFDRSLAALAAADSLALDCRFKEAEDAYAAFAEMLAESAKVKRQYAGVVAEARKRRQEAAKNLAAATKVEEAISASRGDLSAEKCDYRTTRTEEAIRSLASLPAGCDRYVSDLRSQLLTISKRRADQAAFHQTAAKAREMEDSCQLSSAADGMAHALAILDANPSLRCGAAEETARKLEADLPSARLAAFWEETLAKSVADGENPPQPGKDPAAASLRIVNAALARVPTLASSHCFSRERESLLRVADSSGKSLLVPEDGAVGRLLPNDDKLVATSAAVAEEVRKIEAARESLQHKKEQLELPAAETPPAPGPKPQEVKPKSVEPPRAAPKKPVRRAVNRKVIP